MTTTSLRQFDLAIQKTNIWLNDLLDELQWNDRHRAYHALKAVLHVLRDHLPTNESAQFAAQMPQLIRGLYYEGWKPSVGLAKERHWDEFIARVEEQFGGNVDDIPDTIVRAVFKVISKHVSSGEIDDVKQCLPEDIRRRWP